MRLFIGIPLSAEACSQLERIVAQTIPKLDDWRASQPDSWHITLQFLGATDPQTCAQLVAHLRSIRSPAVPIQLGGLGFFDRAGIFFIDVALTPELIALQQKTVHASAQSGFAPEPRPYRPHVTLARAKGKARSHNLTSLRSKLPENPKIPRLIAAEFLLYESFLGPRGSRYEIRERFALI
jgi:RNA 2',3'-cyclic 3'-phosphodiesterase